MTGGEGRDEEKEDSPGFWDRNAEDEFPARTGTKEESLGFWEQCKEEDTGAREEKKENSPGFWDENKDDASARNEKKQNSPGFGDEDEEDASVQEEKKEDSPGFWDQNENSPDQGEAKASDSDEVRGTAGDDCKTGSPESGDDGRPSKGVSGCENSQVRAEPLHAVFSKQETAGTEAAGSNSASTLKGHGDGPDQYEVTRTDDDVEGGAENRSPAAEELDEESKAAESAVEEGQSEGTMDSARFPTVGNEHVQTGAGDSTAAAPAGDTEDGGVSN